MSVTREFSDETLTAYLDQEADADLVRDIEAAMEHDSALAKRIDDLRFPKDLLGAAFAQQLSAAPKMPELPPAAMHPVAANISDRPKWFGFTTGAATGLAAGLAAAVYFGLNQPVQTPNEPGWLQVVANYQVLYVSETLDPSRSAKASAPAEESDAALANLSKAVGLDLSGLKNVDGLTFHRAQQLGFNGKPLIQIAYSLPDGTPVAICILQSGKDQSAPKAQILAGMASADWNTGQHGVLIIGGEDQTVIETLTDAVQPLI